MPFWSVETSHLLGSVAGPILLFAARGLLHRLDGAWGMASSMALLAFRSRSLEGRHIAPTVATVLLIGLIAARAQFDRRASLLSQPLTAGWLVAIGNVVPVMIWSCSSRSETSATSTNCGGNLNSTPGIARLRTVLRVAVLGLAMGVWRPLRPAAGV